MDLYKGQRQATGVKLAHFVVVKSSIEVEIAYMASFLRLSAVSAKGKLIPFGTIQQVRYAP